MPAVSENQRVAAAIALQAKRGRIPKARLKGASLRMYEGMTEEELEKFAVAVPRKKPPMAAR